MELTWEDLVMPCLDCTNAEQSDACQSSVAMGSPYCSTCNEKRFVPTETGKVLRRYIKLVQGTPLFGVTKFGSQED